MTIGAGINDLDAIEQMHGLIDEVRLWDIELMPGEVAAVMAQ